MRKKKEREGGGEREGGRRGIERKKEGGRENKNGRRDTPHLIHILSLDLLDL